jgi:hypothetical protein
MLDVTEELVFHPQYRELLYSMLAVVAVRGFGVVGQKQLAVASAVLEVEDVEEMLALR